jgi:hypothetical protein
LSQAGVTAFIWAWAFLLAGVEIEIEAAHGWAERLPTWYRKRGLVATVYGWFMARRPLTGYHVFQLPLPLLALHLPYFFGQDWTWGSEAITLAIYFVLAVFWDYLWFVLNPAFTVRRFRKGNVWWFAGPWIWRFPIDYYVGLGFSCLLAAASWLEDDSPTRFYEHLGLILGCAVLTGIAVCLAPLYHRWYRHMRRPGSDDRPLTDIYPPAE